jgi:hypothetical protein
MLRTLDVRQIQKNDLKWWKPPGMKSNVIILCHPLTNS